MKRNIGWGIVTAAAIFSGGILFAEPQQEGGAGTPAGIPAAGALPMARPMPAGEHPPMGPQMRMPSREMLQQAGATDEQIEALKKFLQAQMPQKQSDLPAAMEKANRSLVQLMLATNVDEKAVMAAADVVTQVRGEFFKAGLSAELKSRQILGDEVMARLRAMRSQPPQGQGQGRPAVRPSDPEAGGRALQMRSPLTPIRDSAPTE